MLSFWSCAITLVVAFGNQDGSALSLEVLEFDTLHDLSLVHEESHIEPGFRKVRTMKGNPQPFPDVIDLSFDALGETFSFPRLSLMSNHLAHGVHMSVMSEGGEMMKHPIAFRSYTKNYDSGDWVGVTLKSDTHFRATFHREGTLYYVGTKRELLDEPQLQTDAAKAVLAKVDRDEMMMLRVDPAQLAFDCATTTGEQVVTSSSAHSVKEGAPRVRSTSKLNTSHTHTHARSLLKSYNTFDGCFKDWDKQYLDITIHLIATYGMYQRYGSTEGTELYLADLLAQINLVTRRQLHLGVKGVKFTVLKSPNLYPFDSCDLPNNELLQKLFDYRAERSSESDYIATTHMLNSCRDYGQTGYATVASLCKPTGVGINSAKRFSHFGTFIHELGHSIGGEHPFTREEDYGKFGGIMDYRNQEIDGVLQYNKDNYKNICNHLESIQDSKCASRVPLTGCGNGFVDSDEECDIESDCCDQNTCKFVSGATCISDSDCCVDCKLADFCGWCSWSKDKKGLDYNGRVSTTVDGHTCQAWDSSSPHPQLFPFREDTTGHNYCRNPDGSDGPWCATTSPEKQWAYCDVGTPEVTKCGGPQGSGGVTPSPTKSPLTTLKHCPPLSVPANAKGDQCETTAAGATCTFTCKRGFTAANSQGTRFCQSDLTWAGSKLVCEQQVCPTLSSPAGASSKTCKDATEGDRCKFTCSAGYADNGFAERTCSSGKWTGSPLVCTARVCDTLAIPDGAVGAVCAGKKDGNTCDFSCATDYVPAGPAKRTCSLGKWTPAASFTCSSPLSCPQLNSPAGAVASTCVAKQKGQTCTFNCDVGFVNVEPAPILGSGALGSTSRTCVENSNGQLEWNGPSLGCIPIVCPVLKSPFYAADPAAVCKNKVHSESCTFACKTGYEGNGFATRTCEGGQWTRSSFVCSPKQCPALTPPANAEGADCKNNVETESCTLKCKEGFSTTGDSTRICTNGEWAGFALVCTNDDVQYTYTAGSWGTCSVECDSSGGTDPKALGSQTREVICVDTLDGNAAVDKSKCVGQGLHVTPDVQVCGRDACVTYTWLELEWGDCSANCGTGIKYREVVCEARQGGTETTARVAPELCEGGDPKPPTDQVCGTAVCTENHWVSGVWTKCTEDCGGGTQSREVNCLDPKGNHIAYNAVATECPETSTRSKPEASQQCNTEACGVQHKWRICDWERCTAQCGGSGTSGGLMAGTFDRAVFCTDSKGVRVPNPACALSGAMPPTRIIGCNPDACLDYNWMTTPWTVCQNGERFRTAHCHGFDGSNAKDIDCPADQRPNLHDTDCVDGTCPTTRASSVGSSTGSDGNENKSTISGVSKLIPSFFVVGVVAVGLALA